MDGLPQLPRLDAIYGDGGSWRQRTLKSAISCVGVGVHSGRRASLTLHPAPENHGVAFRRTDVGRTITARFDRVVDTRFCTIVAEADWASVRVGTIEHLMAALSAKGVDNVLVEVDGPELPILDGSAAPFLFLLDCAGIAEQAAPRPVIEIRRVIRVTDGAAFAELRPSRTTKFTAGPVLEMEVSVDFPAAAIGQQSASLILTAEAFRDEIARARTFAMAEEIEHLRAGGFAQGGSLDNAIVVDGERIMNPGGLRMDNEFACHKLLDAIGDLALAGAAIHGRFVAHRPGHGLNNKLLRAVFADVANWRTRAVEPLAAAAA